MYIRVIFRPIDFPKLKNRRFHADGINFPRKVVPSQHIVKLINSQPYKKI
ncbi:predicted protein [Botrytis cinerea T4]|uniref:Uncharacterized protein n=1 Tax=Botryotinia fuckeliana (strain T4) TaxID=999810 RepID=G2XRA6_BOTF4|nr:predicted protein [Botrytis cinerea T4]